MNKDIKKSIYSFWSILYFSFMFSFGLMITYSYYFYYNIENKNIFLITLFNFILFIISFLKINNIVKKIRNNEADEFIYSCDEKDEDKLLKEEDLFKRWKFYKKICYYELLKIKNELLLNSYDKNENYDLIKDELNKISLDDKNISNYKNEINNIIYYLISDEELNYIYHPYIKPLKSIYNLC